MRLSSIPAQVQLYNSIRLYLLLLIDLSASYGLTRLAQPVMIDDQDHVLRNLQVLSNSAIRSLFPMDWPSLHLCYEIIVVHFSGAKWY